MICQCLCSLSPCHLESWAWILYVQLIAGWCDAEQSCHLLYVVGTITVEVVTSKHLLYVLWDMVKPCSFQRHLRVSSASCKPLHRLYISTLEWLRCRNHLRLQTRLCECYASCSLLTRAARSLEGLAAKMRPSGAWLQAPAQIPLDNAAIGTSAKERSFFEHFWTVLTCSHHRIIAITGVIWTSDIPESPTWQVLRHFAFPTLSHACLWAVLGRVARRPWRFRGSGLWPQARIFSFM